MEDTRFKTGRLAIMLGTAAFIVALPFHMGFDQSGGMFTVKASQALAKSGDDDGDDDRGGSGGGGSHDDDDGDDRSGKGSGSSHDDDDDGDDSDDDSSDDSSSSNSSSSSGGTSDDMRVSKIEVSSSGVEVRYSDGSKEEIENGRYERKDSSGRTVEQRPATQADIDRLLSLN